MHEGLGSVGLWRGLPERLNATTGRRTVAFSRFGHGRSAPPPRPRTPAFFHEEALVLLAPHVFVEEVTLESIRATREEYLSGRLRERMARHHDDPDAAFWGWCGVWLDPAFAAWTLEAEARQLTAPTLLIQGADDPYGSLEQLDRIEAAARGPMRRLVLPGGHSPHLEHPERVVEAIASFIERPG